MTQLFGVYSTVEGPDGNGLLTPFDPAAGGIGGTATTTNAAPTFASNPVLPPDLKATDIEVIVMASLTPTAGGPPSDVWRARLGATVIRNGNAVTIKGSTMRTDVRSTTSLAGLSAELVVNTAVAPNVVVPQVQGLSGSTLQWAWRGLAPFSL